MDVRLTDVNSVSLDAALALAAASTKESIDTLAEFVRIPSLTGEEGKAQAWVLAKLAGMGLAAEKRRLDIAATFAAFPNVAQYPTHWQHDLVITYQELPTYDALMASEFKDVLTYDDRPNVVGTLSGTGGGRSLVLNGHVDTVTVEPAGEWTKDPFGAEIVGDLMYGRGTSDMKGGVTAALMALTFLQRAGVKLRGDVVMQCVVNEEHAGNGTLDLVRQGCAADGAIVLEPTSNHVAVSHPGGLYWQVRVPGVQRSPGARWKDGVLDGTSAIEKLPAIIAALRGIEEEFSGHLSHDPLEEGRAPFSLVMGKISGGYYETVTADEVVLRGSAYFAPHIGSIAQVMERFRSAIAAANASDPFLSSHPAQLEFLHHDDSTSQDPGIPPARVMLAILDQQGAERGIIPGPFCCDLRHIVNQGGIPGIIFGPGTIAQAHKPDEHIRLSEYLESIPLLMRFISTWCGVSDAEKS